MIQVSIIIVNYNTAQWVENCIRSILEHTSGIGFEIIVIDNQSPERRIEEVLRPFQEIVFLQMESNIGFGAACNRATKIAKGQYYMFLNPDTELKNNAVKLFLDFWVQYIDSLNIACLGSLLQDNSGNDIHSFGKFPNMLSLIGEKMKSLSLRLLFISQNAANSNALFEGDYLKVDYVTGADMFISKNHFELVNGFDERFFMYFEETDMQLRLAQSGKNALIIKGPIIQHTQGASTVGKRGLLRVFYFNSLLLYFKKHSSSARFGLFKFLWCILDAKTLIQKFTLSSKKQSS
ncbi:MAG: glycosyltransferase family 2 protein [Bacteroidota bacterium]